MKRERCMRRLTFSRLAEAVNSAIVILLDPTPEDQAGCRGFTCS